jgi:alkylated DNA nucleotide flippase Atl1
VEVVQVENEIASLARSFARALEEFAVGVESRGHEADGAFGADQDLTSLVQGARQKQVIGLEGLKGQSGLRTKEIADLIDYDEANTWNVVTSLEAQDFVEKVPGVQPQRWRLAPQYRGSAKPYMAMAAHVHAGEWATYGDVAVAVTGRTEAARAVGRAAAKLPSFPNPHRILGAGGRIPDGWRSGEGLGPDECQRRLEAEGMSFRSGRADHAKHLSWEELKRRADEA